MKKRLLSAALAVAMLFGSAAALPEGVFSESTSITASAETSGYFEYKVLNNGTVEITEYNGKEANVKIPSKIAGKKVTSIGYEAFSDNLYIKNVSLPSTLETIGVGAFEDCKTLTEIKIPANVDSVGQSAFSGCKKLKKVTLETGVKKSIAHLAFYECTSLTELDLGGSVTFIGSAAFKDCTNLKGKKVGNTYKLIIPDSVEEIGDQYSGVSGGTFEGCTALTEVSIGTGLVKLFGFSFEDCDSLRCVNIPGGVSCIGVGAFEGCKTLSSLVIEEGVTKIGQQAFSGCKSLKSVIVPQSVKEIDYGAFDGCVKLEEVYLLEGLVTIGDYAFRDCGFSVITIPDSVVEIGRDTFAHLDDLKIRGFKGSDAQTYAKKNGFKFEAVNGCKHSSYKTAYTVAPTCTSKGYTVKICTRCSKVTKTNYKAAVAHKFTAWKTTGYNFKNNTSTQTRKCSVCGKTEKQNTKNAVSRLAGDNRYATAGIISKKMYPKTSDTVIIATGITYQDALIAVPLASAYNAPLLLATERHITAQTEAELKRLKAKNVIVVSTNGAIGSKAKAEFKALKYKMTYIEGKTCFETAAKVAKALQTKTKKAPDTIFFATDSAFADALSASPVAAIKNAPIIYLKNTGSIDEATANYLKSVKGKVKNAYVIGGDGVISNAMMKNVATALGLTSGKTVVRVAGANRYETCVAVNNKFKSVLNSDGICVAKGLDFPDALAGGVYAAANRQALFLADGKKLQDCQNSYLKGKNAAKITVFGGTGAVSDELVKLIAKASV